MTANEAVAALAPLLGSGGIVAVITAWFGYRAQAAKPTAAVKDAVGLGPVRAAEAELIVNALTGLTAAVMRGNLFLEFQLERRGLTDAFQHFVEEREMKATLEAFKLQQKKPSG